MMKPGRPVSPPAAIGRTTALAAGTSQEPLGIGRLEPVGQAGDDTRHMALQHIADRPRVGRVQGQGRGGGRVVSANPHRADERGRSAARLGHVDHGEGQVAGIGRQGLGGALAGLLPGPGFRGRRRQLAQQGELALADHPLGVIAIGAEYTAGRAVVGRDRAVGESVVGLFGVAIALHDQELLLDIGAFDGPSSPWPASDRCRSRSRATLRTSGGRAPRDACRR